jgi:hypothetical protein
VNELKIYKSATDGINNEAEEEVTGGKDASV